MNILDQTQFDDIVSLARVQPRLRRELRFIASTAHLNQNDWCETELLAITDRTKNRGVLLLAPDDSIFAIPFSLSRGITQAKTGRAQPIICDFCRTWQAGGNAASISFQKGEPRHSVSFLCCADLACSRHVRGKTLASHTSRAQLREDMLDEQRVERLKDRLRKIIKDLQ